MNGPRVILSASSVFLLTAGVVALFVPEIVAQGFGAPVGAEASGFQILGGGALGFGWMNWVGRGAIYGGVYGRPLVLGNVTHGWIVALVMVRWQLDGAGDAVGWGLTAGFLLYAASFALLLYRPPWRSGRTAPGEGTVSRGGREGSEDRGDPAAAVSGGGREGGGDHGEGLA